jgi:hypothetical protein
MLVGVLDYCCSPTAQWLGRDIYFPQIHGFARYNTQNGDPNVRNPGINFVEVMKEIYVLLQAHPQQEVVFILSSGPVLNDEDIGVQDPATGRRYILSIKGVASFQDSVVFDESAHVYHITLTPESGFRL